jgi:hypothetical protein
VKVVTVVALIAVLMLTLVPSAFAEEAKPAPAPVAQAPAKPAPAPTAAGPSVGQRVDALEKQNLVLSEDLGKSQLKARELENLAKMQAEAIAKLNQQLAAEQQRAEAERQKQAKRNQYMWIAVGLVAIATAGR